MRLKKVMAIMLAAGLTVGSLALASTADNTTRTVADTTSTPVPENAEPGGAGSIGNVVAPATVAPVVSDAPATDAPATDAPATDAPATDAPATDAPSTPADPTTPSTTVKKPAKVTLKKKNITVAKKKVTVKVAKVKGAKGYQVKVSTKKNFKKNVKTSNSKTTKITVKGLKKGTKYFVKTRAYKKADGKKVFGKWSAVVSVKTAN